MPACIKENDRVLFYFAGHGIALNAQENRPKGYLLPKDALPNNTERSIEMDILLCAIEVLKCKHFLLVLDCCFSGSFRWANKTKRALLSKSGKIYQERYEHYIADPA